MEVGEPGLCDPTLLERLHAVLDDPGRLALAAAAAAASASAVVPVTSPRDAPACEAELGQSAPVAAEASATATRTCQEGGEEGAYEANDDSARPGSEGCGGSEGATIVQPHREWSREEVLQTLLPATARQLGLPQELLDGLEGCVDHFDLTGSGSFDEAEITLALEQWLEHKAVVIGGRLARAPNVPRASVEEVGYELGRKLAVGVQGTVWRCTKQGSEFCLKGYPKSGCNPFPPKDFLGEARAMRPSGSSHMPKVLELFQDQTFHYMVIDLYTGGDLTTVGARATGSGERLSERWWRGAFRQCMQGLSHLHARGLIHCDVKEPNVMVASSSCFSEPRLVLVDYGLCLPFTDSSGEGGTPGYMPPEVFSQRRWYPCGDTFSLGVMIFQLITGQVPSTDRKIPGVLYADSGNTSGQSGSHEWVARHRELPWDRFPADWALLRALVGEMTERDYVRRPRPAQALQHAWFASAGDAALPAESLQGLLGVAGHGGSKKRSASPCRRQWTTATVLPEPRKSSASLLPKCADGRLPARPHARVPALLPAPVAVECPPYSAR